MYSKQNKTYVRVGMFVVIGFLCFIAIIFHFLNKKFSTDDSQLVVMYFEESIQGLNVGSPVVFQGVEIGKVAKIRLLTNLKLGTFKAPVYVSFKEKKSFQIGSHRDVSGENVLKALVEKGLRARLINANYLTGQLMIELNMEPNTPAIMRGSGYYMEIPTVISSFAMISKDLQEIPIRENLMQLGNILNNLEKKLPPIMDNLIDITTKLDNILYKKSQETTKAIDVFNSTMRDVGEASKSFKNLADYLERHPETLLRGKEK